MTIKAAEIIARNAIERAWPSVGGDEPSRADLITIVGEAIRDAVDSAVLDERVEAAETRSQLAGQVAQYRAFFRTLCAFLDDDQ